MKDQDEAFTQLRQTLTKIQSLGYYNVLDRTQVIADASPVGLAAFLIQIDINGPRGIAFGNRTLADIERRYSQTEKEALALVWGVEHFDVFLFGKPYASIERWVLRLQ